MLHTKKLEDRSKERKCLLRLPDTVILTGDIKKDTKDIRCYSSHQENEYKKIVDAFGVSAALSAKVPVHVGSAIGGDLALSSKREKEEEMKSHEGELYSSTLRYRIVHIASYSFRNHDLKLSEDAREELEQIVKIHNMEKYNTGSMKVKKACETFFETYGSHVCRGPLRFGGHYYWKCHSGGFESTDEKTKKDMKTRAASANVSAAVNGVGISVGGGMDKSKGSSEGEHSEDTNSSTFSHQKIRGGPPEANDPKTWEEGLSKYNSTWALIEREGEMIAVWDIILRSHKDEFGDIVEDLKNTWETMTGLKAKEDIFENMMYQEGVLKEISEWNEEDLTVDQMNENLERLLEIKRSILDKTSLDFWIHNYLTSSPIQNFFESVMNKCQQCSTIELILKVPLHNLVKHNELHRLKDRDFPSIKPFSEWLFKSLKISSMEKECTSFEKFDKYLKKTLDDAEIDMLSADEHLLGESTTTKSQELATNISIAIHCLRSNHQKTCDDILIAIIVHPFQSGSYDNVLTLKPMSMDDLKNMRHQFSDLRRKFVEYSEKKTPQQLQAFLFREALDVCPDGQDGELLKQVKQMMSDIIPPPNLQQDLVEAVDLYLCGSSRSKFEHELKSFLNSHSGSKIASKDVDSLQRVLKTKVCEEKKPEYQTIIAFDTNPAARTMFEALDLWKHYPGKLGLQDALCIRQEPIQLSLKKCYPTNLKQLPYLILHKIMSYDHHCRSDLMSHQTDSLSDDSSSESDDDSLNSESVQCHKDSFTDKSNEIHPMDGLLALILCSDDFLRQDLYSRLAKCQLAVPFLIPDPFTKQLILPLWAMRSIIKEWKCDTDQGEIMEHSHPIISYGMPIVSFIRFGKNNSGTSKSELLNEVISDSHYDHFFHRECAGRSIKLLLGEGLVEMCWYFPAGKPSDVFSHPVIFLNLHGDARQHGQQTKILSTLSSMCFLFVNEDVSEVESDIKTTDYLKQFHNLSIIKSLTKPKSEIKVAIRKRIKKKIQSVKEVCYSSIEEHCANTADNFKVFIDEGGDSCKQALCLARELISKLEISPSSCSFTNNVKEDVLPLQRRDLWQLWAAKEKERYRQVHRGTTTVNNYTAIIDSEKAEIRKKQLRRVKQLTPAMELFIMSLLKVGGDSNKTVRNYFLSYLKHHLNGVSRKKKSKILHSYQAAWKNYLACTQNKKDLHKAKMDSLNAEMINSSFGLEHLLRELGQVYEAALQSSDYGEELSRLPKAVAELFCDGYPVELMDGDAAHVPLNWISAVLKEAENMLEKPNIFVLSVLGLQSTGKSTMLNTVFGLQFNVSAGRCTRGAYIQLLPLNKELKNKTKCSYVVVLDTEGLRHPELDYLQSLKRDNELATFVIGLANITLINLKGELSTDMDDILQTSVHAFLRMTQVKLHPSCQFIHQNTDDSINTIVDQSTFTAKLDEFTFNAAKEEKCAEQYRRFNDVIKFNADTDAHHFPGLWMGSPPMAHVNPDYSTDAQTLKNHLINVLLDKTSKHCHSPSSLRIGNLSSFRTNIAEVWKALLKENFVFSFKNTLEIAAYNSLEAQYSMWDWRFHKDLLRWKQEVENDVNAADQQNVSELIQQKRNELRTFVSDTYTSLKSEMDQFFSESNEIMVQWKARFEQKLTSLSEQLTGHADTYCVRLGNSREAIRKLEREQKHYATFMTTKVQELITKLKQEQDELNENLNRGKLEEKQLKKLVKQDLFTPDHLLKLKQQKVLTDDQADQINKAINRCGENIEEKVSCLQGILFGGVLSKKEVNMILKQSQLSEQQLKHEFDKQWIQTLGTIPFTEDIVRVDDIRTSVEQRLICFVKPTLAGKLIQTLQEKNQWKTDHLELIVEKKHYNGKRRQLHWQAPAAATFAGTSFIGLGVAAVGGLLSGLTGNLLIGTVHFGQPDESLREIQSMTSYKVLEKARHYLQEKRRIDTDFNETFVTELLHLIETTIDKESSALKTRTSISLSPQYYIDVYVAVCHYAVGVFEEMAESYKEKHDPRRYLERYKKGPLFTRYKDQYYQTEAGEAIANTLCAHLERPIQFQLENTLCSKMIGQMKDSEQYFSTKMALKVKVLSDLHKRDDFEDYVVYILNVKQSLEYWLKCYTEDYCDGKASPTSTNTRLQAAAKKEVSRLIGSVEDRVRKLQVNDTCQDIRKWLTLFCQDSKIRKELGVKLKPDDLLAGRENIPVMNLKDGKFERQITHALSILKEKLQASLDNIEFKMEVKHWRLRPRDILQKLLGCTAQCPFCGEQCDLTDPDHDTTVHKHRVSVHRPSCLAGYRDRTTLELSAEFCPAKVANPQQTFKNEDTNGKDHHYKDYQEVYPDWSIEPDPTSGNCLYWKSFVSKYNDALAKRLGEGLKPAEVPKEWSQIQWKDIEMNLRSLYNL